MKEGARKGTRKTIREVSVEQREKDGPMYTMIATMSEKAKKRERENMVTIATERTVNERQRRTEK